MTEDEAEMILYDRLNVIKDIIAKYGEQNFYISFSGGKDSTALSYLVDLAVPNNTIPRVFINTGIEYVAIVKFVKEMQLKDNRVYIIQPTISVKSMLEKDGYPFKSKEHSFKILQYKQGSRSPNIMKYKQSGNSFACPFILAYQFEEDFGLTISHKCCIRLKKQPVHKWAKENHRTITMTGMKNDEGGQRANIKGCAIFSKKTKELIKFHPFMKVTDEWENWFIAKYNIKLCELYYEPYNFKRTGCKGCPFSLDLEKQLEVMERLMPNEAKQCEIIWKPVYDEYRRIGFRLHKIVQTKLF